MQVTRESASIAGSNEWSPWEIIKREPPVYPTLRQIYDLVQQVYNRFPRSSVRVNFQGVHVVRIWSIPNNRSSPLWWNDDGGSFFSFYEIYIIEP